MKREIKFRIWHDGTQEMLYQFTLPMAGVGQDLNQAFAWLLKPIMQYTGLHDKNGKEIYEGDIVHVEYFKMAVGENLGVYETEAELTGVVEFDGLSLILQNIVGEKWQEYTGHDAGEGKCKFMYLGGVYEGSLDASYQMEIIGNIYENAELLNK